MNEDRLKKVLENHCGGYNCAQAVACAYSEKLGLDEKILYQLSSGLGVGMGSMEGSCGAVTAAAMVIGMLAQKKGLSNRDSLRLSRQLTNDFEEKNQALTCKTLKGRDTGNVLRDCGGCVSDSAKLLEKMIDALDKQ